VVPFMAATVGLFLNRRGLRLLLRACPRHQNPARRFGKNFTPMITIEDYTSFFLSIILGLGISFELPVLIFFLAMFGIVSPNFLWKNIRYAILAVFIVAAIITPAPIRGPCASTPSPCCALSSSASASPGGCIPRAARPRKPRRPQNEAVALRGSKGAWFSTIATGSHC
jgi:hypothetical protein